MVGWCFEIGAFRKKITAKKSEQMFLCKDKWTGTSLFAFRFVVDILVLLCYRRERIDPQRIFRWPDVWWKIFLLFLLFYPVSKITHEYCLTRSHLYSICCCNYDLKIWYSNHSEWVNNQISHFWHIFRWVNIM